MTHTDDPDARAGAFGAAHRIPRHAYRNPAPATLDAWIITSPYWHPIWHQYQLAVISLADIAGAPPARLQRPGVTHEILVVALNPEHGPYTADDLPADGLPFLTPINIAEQVTSTDHEARRLGALCVQAVVDGLLCPETADAPDRIRATWSTAIHQTLDHSRDPHHGRHN
ncbi:hypothetical protein ACWD11_22685 [Streptomyces sp. NPDC002776]